MSKNWLLALPILLCLLSCDGFSTGGNPNEGKCSFVLREHPTEMLNRMRVECPYDSSCSIKFHFGLVNASFVDGCIDDYEYRFVQNKEVKINLNSSVDLNLDSDYHVRFSLFDIKNVEKKYDIDLSEILNAYVIRGDSVEVKFFNCLNRMSIYKYRVMRGNGTHDVIELYPDSLKNGKYAFYQDDLYFDEIHFSCGLGAQGSFESDSVYIYGDLYWR